MDAVDTNKRIGRLNIYGKPIIAVVITALFFDIFAGNLQHVYAAIPNELVKTSAQTKKEIAALSEHTKQLVRGLDYSDKVAEDFVKMISNWEDKQGKPVLVAWKQRLIRAMQDYKQGKISETQIAKVEENIIKGLGRRIQEEIPFDSNATFFDLADAVKNKKAKCHSNSQLVYILGNSLGLSVRAIRVVELHIGLLSPGVGHLANIMCLTDGRTMMVDLDPNGFISKPFILEEEFAEVGNYWELEERTNPLRIHRRIRTLDTNGIISYIHGQRGMACFESGEYNKAIGEFTKAIKFDHKNARAYCNRGGAYYTGFARLSEAIIDFTKAIEIDPKYAGAYNNRGTVYTDLDQLPQAITDLNKAIELNPQDAAPYHNLGNAYRKLGKRIEAIANYTKAIELNPKYVEAYCNRGIIYAESRDFNRAITEFTKAIGLDPKYAKAYCNRGIVYTQLGDFNKAITELTKAIELDPKDAGAYHNLGNAYVRLDEPIQAITNYTKTIELNPKYFEAYCNRGILYAVLRKPAEAKKDLLKAVELNPGYKAKAKRISDKYKLDLNLD